MSRLVSHLKIIFLSSRISTLEVYIQHEFCAIYLFYARILKTFRVVVHDNQMQRGIYISGEIEYRHNVQSAWSEVLTFSEAGLFSADLALAGRVLAGRARVELTLVDSAWALTGLVWVFSLCDFFWAVLSLRIRLWTQRLWGVVCMAVPR